ncbi:c-type cytochrome [Thiocapsa rosea]|uniref:Cytochrome c553 n=1 Tax=Thiocapsa rosea TaxID=69360 RepID=A0A495VC79_9GAMM|nr:c-type cytochrome [Thiocapsa rosea]RKT46390.1 cytochrome c553 [Thiocapsa rosea]
MSRTGSRAARCFGLVLGCLLAVPVALAEEVEDRFADADLDNAVEINEVCAGCHGEYGQGGKDGEYPRLAGLPAAFIARQLDLFRVRERENLAMVEHTDHRQMPDSDIRDISAFLAAIELPSRLPPVDENAPDFNAYERLMATKQIVQIPRAEGDTVAGGRLYDKECASCHGRDGRGRERDAVPVLAGQYTGYMLRQVDKYIDKRRVHDPSDPDAEELLAAFTAEELRDIFAYISILDD